MIAEALRQAIESRRPGPGLIHHSDRGCQYTSDRYMAILNGLGITVSMCRTGCCYDNAVCERFFWSLKHEWTNHRSCVDLPDMHRSVFQYIELFYNRTRLHQALGYVSSSRSSQLRFKCDSPGCLGQIAVGATDRRGSVVLSECVMYKYDDYSARCDSARCTWSNSLLFVPGAPWVTESDPV